MYLLVAIDWDQFTPIKNSEEIYVTIYKYVPSEKVINFMSLSWKRRQ